MTKSHFALVFLLFFVSFARGAEIVDPSDKSDKTFTGDAAVIREQMKVLFQASRKVNGADKAQARADIDASMDWQRIAHDCLGSANWKKQPEKNRAEFEKLLHEVVVKTAYSRLDKFWDASTTYKFDKIDVTDKEAHVRAKFAVSGDTVALDYYLGKNGAKWLIHDIAFEDNRYSTNINEQLTAFLKEKPFSALVASLKKRRDELSAQQATPKKEG